jgi:hypothetical protein
MGGRALLAAFVLLAIGVGTAVASGDPYLDQANRVPCPSAPPGWVNPPASENGRTVLTPLTVLTSADGIDVYSAAQAVEIDCDYKTDAGKEIQLSVRYALPSDLNPWSDFYIGCTALDHPEAVSTASEAWSDKTRVYRVVGKKTWSLATFVDPAHQLVDTDIPHFEAIANTLLKGVQSFAHNCSLAGNGKPVGVKSFWKFSFSAHVKSNGMTSSGSTTGSFTTTASGTAIGAIGSLEATNFRLSLSDRGAKSGLTVHIAAPLGFTVPYGTKLRARIVVLASNDTGCHKGATGTLLVADPLVGQSTVKLSVCGHSYLDGKGTEDATIASV